MIWLINAYSWVSYPQVKARLFCIWSFFFMKLGTEELLNRQYLREVICNCNIDKYSTNYSKHDFFHAWPNYWNKWHSTLSSQFSCIHRYFFLELIVIILIGSLHKLLIRLPLCGPLHILVKQKRWCLGSRSRYNWNLCKYIKKEIYRTITISIFVIICHWWKTVRWIFSQQTNRQPTDIIWCYFS